MDVPGSTLDSHLRRLKVGPQMLKEIIKLKSLLFLLAILVFSLFLGGYVPLFFKEFSYSLSLSIKDLLIFILPFLIFAFVLSSIVNLKEKAFSFIALLLPLICMSSYLATWIAYFCGKTFIQPNIQVEAAIRHKTELATLWHFNLPHLFSNDVALLAAIIFGLIISYKFPNKAEHLSAKALVIANILLNRFIVPIMPLFILGFTLKLEHEKVLVLLCQNYLSLFALVFISVFSYILLLFAILSGFKFQIWWSYIKNLSTAVLTGFSTMSSAAAMPFTITASETNTEHPEIARSVVPATTNIHLIGDCFAISIFALAILLSFSKPIPSYETYAIFAFYFVLAKFAVAAVPGGGILVMLPILSQNLGFSGEMLSVITAIYLLFDPVITAANVMGNGAFAIIFSRVFNFIKANSNMKHKYFKN